MKNTNSKDGLISQLIAGQSCVYKPDGEHCCGHKHGQVVDGRQVFLYLAMKGMDCKGYICDRCIPLIEMAYGDLSAYSPIPITEVAARSVEHMYNGRASSPTSPEKKDGPKQAKAEQKSKQQRHGKKHHNSHGNRRNERQPQGQQPRTAEAPKAVESAPTTYGGRWNVLVTSFGLPKNVFDTAVEAADKSGGKSSIIEELKRTEEGREALERWTFNQSGNEGAPVTHAV